MQLDSGIEIGGTSAQPVLNIMNAARERNDRIAAIKRAEDERNRQEFLGLVSKVQHNVQGKYYDSYVGMRDKYINDLASMYAKAQQNGGRIDIKDQIEMTKRSGELESYVANVQEATKSEAEWITKLATLDPNKYDLNKTKENLQTISNIKDPYVQNKMFADPNGILVTRPYKIDWLNTSDKLRKASAIPGSDGSVTYSKEKYAELAGNEWDNDFRAQEEMSREDYVNKMDEYRGFNKPPSSKKTSGSGGKKLKQIGNPITSEYGIEERMLPDKITGVPVTDKFYYMEKGKLKPQTVGEDEAGTADFVGISTIGGEKYAKLIIGTESESSFLMNFGGEQSKEAKLSKKPIYVPLNKYMDILGADYDISSLSSDGKETKAGKKENKYGI